MAASVFSFSFLLSNLCTMISVTYGQFLVKLGKQLSFLQRLPSRYFLVNSQQWRRCKICSKVIIKTPEWCYWHRFSVFFVYFEQFSPVVLVYQLLIWTSKCWLSITIKLGKICRFFGVQIKRVLHLKYHYKVAILVNDHNGNFFFSQIHGTNLYVSVEMYVLVCISFPLIDLETWIFSFFWKFFLFYYKLFIIGNSKKQYYCWVLRCTKKWSFPLRISSVNVPKYADCGFGHIYWSNP